MADGMCKMSFRVNKIQAAPDEVYRLMIDENDNEVDITINRETLQLLTNGLRTGCRLGVGDKYYEFDNVTRAKIVEHLELILEG